MIYSLASGLIERRHKVTLLGTADSYVAGASLIPIVDKGWVDLPSIENSYLRETATLIQLVKKIIEVQSSFDIIHNHLYPEFFTPLIEKDLSIPLLTTLHVQATNYIDKTLSLFSSKFIAISQSQKKVFNKTRITDVIYNGIDTSIFSLVSKKDKYLLWIGRIIGQKNNKGEYMDPKGVKHAIKLATLANSPLLLTGTVENIEAFNHDVKPFLGKNIHWIGPVSKENPLKRDEVVKLMQNARAYLMTVNWEEPFGLVMAEAMSCGTPVIGFNRGAVSELINHKKTGFIVNPSEGVNGLRRALNKIDMISPRTCRQHVEKNFSVNIMVENYEKIYNIINEKA